MSGSIVCIPTGMSRGHERFPERKKAPRLKLWRCNLTALSHTRNLYFVAFDDTIHVYQPSFPDQNLGTEPALILCPPTSAPDLHSGIDREEPHSITRLLVDYLGNEEVILATCDDGDVVGYRIEEVQKTLDRRSEWPPSDTKSSQGVQPKLFLHRNVGASAWGLAIHRHARMIAISANTHNVTVLAYALADSKEASSYGFSEDALDTADEDTPDFPSPRKRDHIITLSLTANIPAVSFDNTGKDPDGRWLFSSSIDGRSTLWDLHKPQSPARVFHMGTCSSTILEHEAPRITYGYCACLHPDRIPHGAWGAMFLDLRSISESPLPERTNDARSRYFEDESSQRLRFKNMPWHSAPHEILEVQNQATIEVTDMTIVDGSSEEPESSSIPSNISNEYAPGGFGEMSISNFSAEGEVTQSDSLFIPEATSQPNTQPNAASGNQPLDIDDSGSDTYESEDFDMSGISGRKPPPARPYLEFNTAPTFQNNFNIEAPCLIITKEEIYLLQRPFDITGDYNDLIKKFRQPYQPEPWTTALPSLDRHSFHTQIPELGIFLIASPIGRVAIFRITKSRSQHSHNYHNRNQDDAYMQDPTPNQFFTYGFQLEYVLPFSHGAPDFVCCPAMPGSRMLGVAVAPIQGMYDEGEEATSGVGRDRRWRIIMYYTDHTVVSYEISRKREDEDGRLDDLVV